MITGLTWIRPMEGEAAAQILARLQTLETENQTLKVQMLAMEAQQANTPETPPPEAAPPTQKGIDLKLLGKPPTGIRNDAAWPTWHSTVTSYLQAVDPDYVKLMAVAENSDVSNAMLNESEANLSVQLYFILRMTITEGKAADKPLTTPAGEGLLLWRKVVREYEPEFASRTQLLYNQVMAYRVDNGNILPSLDAFDLLCLQYAKASGNAVEEKMKAGVVLNGLAMAANDTPAAKLSEHLILNAEKFSSYGQVRDEIQ